VLAAAYTVLAVAAGARATVQLATRAAQAPVPYALSAAAAVVYLVLAVALGRGGRWRTVAVTAAAAELAGVLAVGTWERLAGQPWADTTVWSGYGAGYAWAPLVLPAVALIALTRRAGADPDGSPPAPAAVPGDPAAAPIDWDAGLTRLLDGEQP
jgi:hypothetical protein